SRESWSAVPRSSRLNASTDAVSVPRPSVNGRASRASSSQTDGTRNVSTRGATSTFLLPAVGSPVLAVWKYGTGKPSRGGSTDAARKRAGRGGATAAPPDRKGAVGGRG